MENEEQLREEFINEFRWDWKEGDLRTDDMVKWWLAKVHEAYLLGRSEVREKLMSMAEITVDGSAKYWKMPWHKDFQDGDKFAPQRFIDALLDKKPDHEK